MGRIQATSQFVLSLLAAPAMTGLITVGIGGLTGQWLADTLQRGSRKQEVVTTWIAARGKLALESESRYRDAGVAVLDSTFRTLSGVLAAVDQVSRLGGPEWHVPEGRRFRADAQRIVRQHADARREFNSANKRWDLEKEHLGLLLDHYYGAETSDVYKSWRRVVNAVDRYSDVAQERYRRTYEPAAPVLAAQAESTRSTVDSAVVSLMEAIRANRRYSWSGWDSPEALEAYLQVVK